MLRISLLLACATLCYAVEDMRALYSRTKLMYGGVTASMNPVDEKEHYKSFVSYVKMVDEINHDASLPYNAEINFMSLETEAERHAHLGLNISKMVISHREHIPVSKRSVDLLELAAATEVNHSNKLPGIKNQGSCGSCWTFGAIAALEYQINRDKKGSPRALSEQECLDCAYPSSRDGCNGGWPTACYDYANSQNSKLSRMADYPYVAKDGNCLSKKKKNSISGFTVQNDANYITKGDAAMLIAVADERKGVMSVAIAVINSMYSYKDGVYKPSGSCSSVNHAVDVVGYGVFKGIAYWRVRNSWGDAWGDKGYVNMQRGTNGKNLDTCKIATYAHYPEVSGSDDGTNGDDDGDDGGDDNDGGNEDGDWCKHENSALKGYSGNSKVTMVDLKTAKSACGSRSDCKGITVEKNGDITLRKSAVPKKKNGLTSYLPGTDCGDDDAEPKCIFQKEAGVMYTKSGGNNISMLKKTLAVAQAECLKNNACGGISCWTNAKCGLKKKASGKKGSKGYSYKKVCR